MRTRIPTFCATISLLAFVVHALPAVAQVDQERAQEYFKEVQALCEREGGRLWGVSLCGPMVVADLRRQFVEGPLLLIRGGGSGMSNSQGAVVIPGVGTVYFGPTTDSGSIEAEKGVLVETDGTVRRLPAPVRRDDATLVGDGWTFTAKPGSVIREGSRLGDYEVVRQ